MSFAYPSDMRHFLLLSTRLFPIRSSSEICGVRRTEWDFTHISKSFVRAHPLAFHLIVSNNAVRVGYAVCVSPNQNLTDTLTLFVKTHPIRLLDRTQVFSVKFQTCVLKGTLDMQSNDFSCVGYINTRGGCVADNTVDLKATDRRERDTFQSVFDSTELTSPLSNREKQRCVCSIAAW